MEKLSIEEKAKAYDKALERAKVWKEKSEMPKDKQGILDDIFPELAESEDDRIRKELIKFVKVNIADEERYIAWLEKQGEKKSVTIDIDKMVSKYSHTKDGDFGLPVMCQLRSYRQGINDALKLSLNIEKQGEQKLDEWSEEDESYLLLK